MNLNKPARSLQTGFQKTTTVLRTVARWTVTVKSRKPSASTPSNSLKIIR